MICKKCFKESPGKESIQQFSNDTYHIRVDCITCGAYQGYRKYDQSDMVKSMGLSFADHETIRMALKKMFLSGKTYFKPEQKEDGDVVVYKIRRTR